MKTLGRERDRDEILRRLKGVRADNARRWGRMSAHQMVCHLCDSFRMAMGAKDVSDATGLGERTVIKWIALYAPLRWPAGITTRPEVDQELGGTRPSEFSCDVAELETLIDAFTRSTNLDERSHPIFGPMSRAAWLRWAYLHTDHHFRQFGI